MSLDYIIRHAAPTLAGLKTGSLFPCAVGSQGEFLNDLRRVNRAIVPRGLRLLPLRLEPGRALLYLFRPEALSADLSRDDARHLLLRAGYETQDPLFCLRELKRRLREQREFPHEIGLFLGYPPEDVRGFMDHRGRNCKCAGCWKVYGDPLAAQRRFAAYKACTDSYCRRFARGEPIEGLTVPS